MQANKKPYLDPETDVEGDDFIDSETITADLEAARERRQNRSLPLRTTLLADDGQRLGPAMMTTVEANAHLAEWQAGSAAAETAELPERTELPPGTVVRNGLPLFPKRAVAEPVTLELVQRLAEEN